MGAAVSLLMTVGPRLLHVVLALGVLLPHPLPLSCCCKTNCAAPVAAAEPPKDEEPCCCCAAKPAALPAVPGAALHAPPCRCAHDRAPQAAARVTEQTAVEPSRAAAAPAFLPAAAVGPTSAAPAAGLPPPDPPPLPGRLAHLCRWLI